MKKIKLILALVLGLMCTTGMVAPVKAATPVIPAPTEATPYVQYRTENISCVGYTVKVNYHVNIRANGAIDGIVYDSVSSNSPSAWWAVFDRPIGTQKIDDFHWKATFTVRIVKYGENQGRTIKTIDVYSGPM